LFVDHPQVAPWFVRQGPIVLLVALTCGIAVALAARRRLASVP
jgi:alpha-1,6-mannosyltransferase